MYVCHPPSLGQYQIREARPKNLPLRIHQGRSHLLSLLEDAHNVTVWLGGLGCQCSQLQSTLGTPHGLTMFVVRCGHLLLVVVICLHWLFIVVGCGCLRVVVHHSRLHVAVVVLVASRWSGIVVESWSSWLLFSHGGGGGPS